MAREISYEINRALYNRRLTTTLWPVNTELGLGSRNRRRQVAAAVMEVCTVLSSPVRVADVACVRPCACVGGRVRVVVAPNHGYVAQREGVDNLALEPRRVTADNNNNIM
ncbi:unnamed protein product [Macrosiphum euphorbiae]|uniref:Uncharacterized protein n=1 Tax=Macrosiphum euphorbiae TaxID=13131 RepID=A0AAV0VV72_9HEMI|nr:unnamed protein product [Macrosiphum euphorbiae]